MGLRGPSLVRAGARIDARLKGTEKHARRPNECILDSQMLPLFLAGNSLGGGLAACLVLQRPSYFKGVMLLAPMLTVSDEVKPPWLVQMIFKHLLARLCPTWPVTPSKGPLRALEYVF